MKEIIAIIGVGYVGLQTALNFAKNGFSVIGYDKNKYRIDELINGFDCNNEVSNFKHLNLSFTNDPLKLSKANVFFICVPTPINEHLVPDLSSIKDASKLVADFLKKNDVVILESTVYPGATRDIVISLCEQRSALKSGIDFFVGYSSERINPGDVEHQETNVTKIISGQNSLALKKIEALYKNTSIEHCHCTPSMEVAEASKLLENIQRDVNIALMNEFTQIMNQMDIPMSDVLDAARTKWNFLPFSPGFVGGHCIPLNAYYLIYAANKLKSQTNLIRCARQVNDRFVKFIEEKLVLNLAKNGLPLKGAKVAIAGISFKANVSDTRNSLSIALYQALKSYGINTVAYDPIASHEGLDLNWAEWNELDNCSAIVLCVAHAVYLDIGKNGFEKKLISNGLLIDIPDAFTNTPLLRDDITYWRL